MKKLKCIAFLVLLGSMFIAPLFAQEIKFSVDLKNVPISKVMSDIESKSDYSFFINDSHINVNTIVSVSQKNANLSQILDQAFASTGYSYSIIEKQIVIYTKGQKPATPDKKRIIQGKILDSNLDPVIGGTVKIKDSKVATVTDYEGNFSIEASDNDFLEIYYLGFVPKIISAKDDKAFTNIVLQEDSKMLDEVVVVGYGTQQKKTLTGAVSMINMNDIEASTKASISQALAGKAAGLRVNQVSAQPGGAAKLRIRGEGSINAGNEPLIVIDGFPISGQGSLGSGNIYSGGDTDNILSSMNPEDIESISVLKDAASTAIYGARAGHGVILITTKRGTNKKPVITYSGAFSSQKISSDYEMLDVKSFMDMRNKQYYEDYLRSYGLGIYSEYITMPEGTRIPDFKPVYTNDEINHAKETNWLDLVTRTGFMQQQNFSITGGGETTRYMASINYMKQDGVVKNNGVQRMTARFNLDQDVNKFVSLGFTSTYSQNRFDNVPLGNDANEYSGVLTAAIQANPANPVYDSKGNYYIDPMRSFVPNPVSLLEMTDKTVKDRIMGLGYIIVKPLKDLELKAQAGADRKFQKRSNYIPKTTLEGQKSNGNANIAQQDDTDYLLNAVATYSKKDENYQLKTMIGYEYQLFTGESVNAGSQDFLIDGFLYHNLGAGSVSRRQVGSGAWKSSIASYFARANFMYKSRYLVEGTIRADGASNFAPDNRWGYFPSISAGWIISEEPFMEKTNSWLSNLKLRPSFGQTGNSNVGYKIIDLYSLNGRDYVIGDNQNKGAYAYQLGNPDLTWETTTEFNIGLDAGFWKNRIRFTAEYFNRKITNLLSTKTLLSYNEVDKISANIGSTQSQGFELTLNTANIITKDFEWNTTFTLSRYNDRWLTRASDWAPKPYEKANDPIRAWWSYESLGILRPGEPAPAAQLDLLPGMVIIKDQNNDGVINDKDLLYVDNGDPKFYYGFSNTLRYKHFDLNIYFYGESGRRRGESYKESWTYMEKAKNVSVFALESFNSNNTNSNNPSFLAPGIYGWGDMYVKPIYYIRCGNITLGYQIPNKIVKNLRVYADVSNPFIITNWTGLDPETDNGNFPYPNVRSYTLGLNITF